MWNVKKSVTLSRKEKPQKVRTWNRNDMILFMAKDHACYSRENELKKSNILPGKILDE